MQRKGAMKNIVTGERDLPYHPVSAFFRVVWHYLVWIFTTNGTAGEEFKKGVIIVSAIACVFGVALLIQTFIEFLMILGGGIT